MIVTSVINPTWANSAHTMIDCTVTFSNPTATYPMLVTANGDTPYMIQLWNDLMASRYGTIAPYVVPTPTTAQQIAALQAQLVALDEFIPRGLEDTWTAIGFNTSTLPAIQQSRLAQKLSLRAQIAAL